MLNDREKVFRSYSGTSPSNGTILGQLVLLHVLREVVFGIQDRSCLHVLGKENCVMVDFCLTCSVANFESFGKECKSGVRIQDGCDLQSLPILPKQECILGHWFLLQVFGSYESVSVQDR